MPRLTYTCKNCGKTFQDYPSQAPLYCSKPCHYEYRVRNGISNKPKTGRYEPCAKCGKDVWRTLGDQRKGARKYCSRECANVGKAHAVWIERACDYCGAMFSLREKDPTLRCSKRCDELRRIKKPLDRKHNGVVARLDAEGYVWVWEPEHAVAASKYNGWIQEHRLVAERTLGHPLGSDVDVHHINRIKHDNRPENLEVVDPVTHTRYTANERMTDRRLLDEYIRRFGPIDAIKEVPWLADQSPASR